VFVLLTTGCSDDHGRDQHAEQRSGLSREVQPPGWLDANAKVEPAAWLINREMAAGRHLDVQDESKLRQSLATAATRFKEDPRMIANRAVQLETMLDTKGRKESAVWLINQLSAIVREPGRVEGFGALGQQYYNMRKAGLSEQETLNELTNRYRPRG
jgi:hypothetical protein